MPLLKPSDNRTNVLRSILSIRGKTCKDVAKATHKPVSTITYQVRNPGGMSVGTLQMYANALNMTDAEIAAVVKGRHGDR